MNENQKESNGIDIGLYGLLIKKARIKKGFKRGEDFIAEIARMTGHIVSRDIYYRVENGSREPSVNLYFAINLTLFGRHHLPHSDDFSFMDNDLWKRIEGRSDFYAARQIANGFSKENNPSDIAYYSDVPIGDDEQYWQDFESYRNSLSKPPGF